MLQYLAQIASWVPAAAALVGALVGVFTALQACFLVLSPFWPGAGKVAGELGTLALDLQRLAGWIGKLAGFFGKDKGPRGPRGPRGGAGQGLMVFGLVTVLVVGCAGLQHGTEQVCTVLDSGNPAIGALCLTLEEIESVFAHVRATRSMVAAHPDAQRKIDICEATVPPSAP